MDLKTYINEHVISRRSKHMNAPKKGCTIEDIVKWLDSMGVEGVDWDGGLNKPQAKLYSVLYQIGPCEASNTATIWVAVSNNVGGKEQRIVLKPRDTSFYTENWKDRFESMTEFDTAIIAIEEMISDPRKLVDFERLKKNTSEK